MQREKIYRALVMGALSFLALSIALVLWACVIAIFSEPLKFAGMYFCLLLLLLYKSQQ